MPPAKAKQLGTLLKRHRETQGLSLEAVASEAGMPRSTLLRLERGEFAVPDPDKLQRLAEALGIEPEELFARYPAPDGLPDPAPYLRAKFGMSKEAIAEAEALFEKHAGKSSGGRRGKPTR